jgi:hypothetical protein
MDRQSPSAKRFSVSAIIVANYRSIYTHRLQWYRWILFLAMAVHLTPNFGKLYWHYTVGHTPSVLPDFFACSLSVAARVTWAFLFRDPSRFLGFRRPARAYRWVVCGTVVMTTLPNFIVHIWALKMALKKDGLFYSGRVAAASTLFTLVPLMGFVWWIAYTFLLGFDESNTEFEPTAKSRLIGLGGQNRLTCTFALDRIDYLSQLYKEQKLAEQEPHENQNLTEPSGDLQFREAHRQGIESVEPSLSRRRESAPTLENASPPRCQTTARLECMSQAHSGPHSWLSFPMVPLVLSIYATILLVGLPIFIHEDREYKLRPPTP